MIWRIVGLIVGVFCCSVSVILIKACTVPPALLAAYRLLIASVLLSPLFWRQWRRHRATFGGRQLLRTLPPGLTLAAHFISWTIGARMTFSANASLIVNMVPVAMPFMLYFTIRERVVAKELLGTVVALAGVFLLTSGDYVVGREAIAGDAVCFGSMLLFAFYLTLGRKNRDFPGLWLYLVPLYASAGVFCLVAAAFTSGIHVVFAPREYLFLGGLAVIPTILGHSLINQSMRHLRGQIVSVTNLGQFIFAGITAYLVFGEIPPDAFYGAGVLIFAGAWITIRATPGAAVVRSAMVRSGRRGSGSGTSCP